jgi:hypothetical protein
MLASDRLTSMRFLVSFNVNLRQLVELCNRLNISQLLLLLASNAIAFEAHVELVEARIKAHSQIINSCMHNCLPPA